MHTQSKKGFTLIELLVVIAIIGILSSVVIVSLNTARAKARDASRQSNVQAMGTAIAIYSGDQTGGEKAPTMLAAVASGWDNNQPDVTQGTPVFSNYMKTLPTDTTTHTYTFQNAGPDTTYCLGTHLETSTNTFICNSSGCAASSGAVSAYSAGSFTAWPAAVGANYCYEL